VHREYPPFRVHREYVQDSINHVATLIMILYLMIQYHDNPLPTTQTTSSKFNILLLKLDGGDDKQPI
jgi:hypothetical protein